MGDTTDERLARMESQLETILAEQVETRNEQKEVRSEIKKFNELIATGRGAIFVILGVGSALLWLWGQIKGAILK